MDDATKTNLKFALGSAMVQKLIAAGANSNLSYSDINKETLTDGSTRKRSNTAVYTAEFANTDVSSTQANSAATSLTGIAVSYVSSTGNSKTASVSSAASSAVTLPPTPPPPASGDDDDDSISSSAVAGIVCGVIVVAVAVAVFVKMKRDGRQPVAPTKTPPDMPTMTSINNNNNHQPRTGRQTILKLDDLSSGKSSPEYVSLV
jgi:H+/gluconate symporter-like permease